MNPPTKPNDSDCCGSGCNPCIFDIYEELLNKYNKQLNNKTNEQNPTENNCISKTSYSIFRLIKKEYDSENTYLYTFKYVRKNNEQVTTRNFNLFYEAGQHFLLRGEDLSLENKYFTRAYTPIFDNRIDLTFTVLIKLLNTGLMSNYFKKLQINAETFWRGPYNDYKINYKLKHLLMICQGTGIAPIFSIINKITQNDDCETFLKLFYCCKNSNTIHLRNQIYKFAAFWNFTYEIFLSRNEINFDRKYHEIVNCRRLQQNDLEKYFENKTENGLEVLICGNVNFCKEITKFVTNCNINKNCIYIF